MSSTDAHLEPVDCLIGPTASGKSSLALWLAQTASGTNTDQAVEIVSMDSALIYKAMDIGTAKPTAPERAQTAHHVIDILEPEEVFSVAQFLGQAKSAIQAIRGRGNRPLVVGGTMLYFRALLQGLDDLPSTPLALRQQIAAKANSLGWPALHAELQTHDSVTAQRLNPNDAQRISRALEVFLYTGMSLSDWIAKSQSKGDCIKANPLTGSPLRVLALQPEDRAWLHGRIEQRFMTMLDQGFLDEVRQLRTRPGLSAVHPSMRAVGYRQAWAYLAGEQTEAAFVSSGLASSRQLAKRQITWLRSFDGVERLDPSAMNLDALREAVFQWWQARPKH
jgi:tRNA dimethylallyltransferase